MIDFAKIVKSTEKYNFHSHTQFCDGRATIEDFVVEAITQGFKYLGFSPHSPIPIESPCNMSEVDVPVFLSQIEDLKSKYGDRIKLYASMEIDYLGEWGPACDYFKSLPLDYKIGSVHFIPSFNDETHYIDVDGSFDNFKIKMEKHFNNDIKSVVETFYKQTQKMIGAGGFDVIGHFDKIGYNASCFQPGIENESWYQKLVRDTFNAIVDNHYIIEVNTKAYENHNRFFPNERYFKWLKEYDVPVLVNSDVHFPELINSGRDEAFRLLK